MKPIQVAALIIVLAAKAPANTTGSGHPEGQEGIRWRPLLLQSGLFLGVKHAFRLATEPGTRDGLKGPFFRGYYEAFRSLHGWSDGDPFYVNYVGHPMQGAVSGYLLVQNDLSYQAAEFGRNARYWKSRARGAAWAWAHSTQFEIGPLSEASIGKIQRTYPQQGFVDHVATPTLGFVWMMAEDSLDKYLIRALEDRVHAPWIRLIARTGLNPARTFANAVAFRAPWHRDTRRGILSYRPTGTPLSGAVHPEHTIAEPDWGVAPPFEFLASTQASLMQGPDREVLCIGGGGSGNFRLSQSWSLVADVGGCKLLEMQPQQSGDILTFRLGPRFTYRSGSRWMPHGKLLLGGQRVTVVEQHPDVVEQLLATSHGRRLPNEWRPEYTQVHQANGFSLAFGLGVDVGLNRAASLQLANLEYSRAWLPPSNMAVYPTGLRFSVGVVLRVGTW